MGKRQKKNKRENIEELVERLKISNHTSFEGNIQDFSEKLEAEIHDACFKNETEKVTDLLRTRRTEIDANRMDINEALFLAIDNKNTTIVQELLKITSNANAKNWEGDSALLIALKNNCFEIVDLLLQNGASLEENLIFAMRKGMADLVEKILKLGVNINKVKDKIGQSPLHLAIELNNFKIVKLLLEHKANANFENLSGKTLLQFAVSQGYVEIIKELLKFGAKVDLKDCFKMTPLRNAILSDRIDIAKILLEHGANMNNCWMEDRSSVLHYAVAERNLSKVEFLLKNQAVIDSQDSYASRTPLHLAAMYRDAKKIVKMLLINGANCNLIDNEELTAFQNSSNRTRKLFFDYAIDLNLNLRTVRKNTAFEDDIENEDIASAKMIAYHLTY